nr:lauroyl acyltransferase [uncultured Cohaesibacter sp.]
MKRITLLHRIEYALFFCVISVFRLMPLSVASSFMGHLWRLIAPWLRRQKRAMAHLHAAFPEMSDKELYAITLDMWENLGRTSAEAMVLEKFAGRMDELISAPNGYREIVERIKKEGGVIVSLHSGNWELGGAVSSHYGFDCSVVMQRLQNPLVHEFLVAKRAESFSGGVFVKGDRAGMRALTSIAGGTATAIMGDLRDRRGPRIDFFGRPAPTNTFPARLARKKGAPLIALRIGRVEGIHFEVQAELIDVPQTDDVEADILNATIGVQKKFEEWVRQAPSQWMWSHRRWGRPETEQMIAARG